MRLAKIGNSTGRDCDYRSGRGVNRLRRGFHVDDIVKARVRRT